MKDLQLRNTIFHKEINPLIFEQVEVKLRTPTPISRHDEPTVNPFRQHAYNGNENNNNDDNDDDDEIDSVVSSVSSQDDVHYTLPAVSLQRKHSNSFWHKSNSVAILPPMNNTIDENVALLPPDYPNGPQGRTFRVRRRVQESVESEPSDSVVSIPTPSSRRPQAQSVTFSIHRRLPNTNTVLVEHRPSHPNSGSSRNQLIMHLVDEHLIIRILQGKRFQTTSNK
ncbi:hypothetical protein I4U23_026857 [Adineta vaga]|nr:hypothetical protein I4U23_026857 [Adineta vaga]